MIYKHFPKLHKLLMKNKSYSWYKHVRWNYGGLFAYIRHLEKDILWYRKNYRKNI